VTEPRLLFVALRIRDFERAALFYRRAFDVQLFESHAPEASADISQAEAAYLQLAVTPSDNDATTGAHVGFEVDDLEAAHRRATAAGAGIVHEPRDGPWGRTAAYRDLHGNVVMLAQRSRPLRSAGVDMASGGWAVIVLEDSHVVDVFRCETFSDALLVDAQVIGVDIPIGIPDEGPRPADVAARRFVGARRSAVFPTPVRSVLEAPSYAEARAIATELTGKSISAQAYALRRRILEVDEYAADDERLIEVHPEVSFRQLAHRPLQSKHTSFGLAERRTLLEEAGIELPASARRVNETDLLDAAVAAWTAARYARAEALPLPEDHAERIGAIWR
jgi:predicted RNase H-like nuclease/predicted enzyme related to lactoylglutathione lyase